MCSVAASVVSRQYMHVRRSSRSQRPTWRKPCVLHVDRRQLAKRRKARQRRQRPSSTFLQLTPRPRSAGIFESATNPRLPRFGHSRPQSDSSVFDRLSASKPVVGGDRVLRAQPAQARHAPRCAAWPRRRSARRRRRAHRDWAGATRCAKPSEVMPVTCQNRSSSTTPSSPARLARPVVGERSVDQQVRPRFGSVAGAPCLQQREVRAAGAGRRR